MKRIILLITMVLIFKTSFGCLNGNTLVLKSGLYVYEDYQGRVPQGHMFMGSDAFNEALKEMDSLYKVTKNLDYLSDKGLVLILLGEYDKAIDLYLSIEKLQSRRYSTASNIGTAYELAGQNENALKWIRRAIEIDSTSHDYSEWIHAKILEAKIKGEEYYTSEFLLNTSFGDNDYPSSDLTGKQLNDLANSLYYQLNERVSFVKPKEKLVAQLLFDLGNIEFLLGHMNDAAEDFKRAQEYGYDENLLLERIKLANATPDYSNHEYTPRKKTSYVFGFIACGMVVSVLVGYSIYKWKTD